jgi:hypothetical protein
MLDCLKLPGSLFFILFAFIFTSTAQTLKDETSPEKEFESSLTKESRFKKESGHNQFAKNYFPAKPNKSKTRQDNQQESENPIDWKLRRGNKSFSVEYGISPFNPSNFAGPKEFDVYGRDLHLFSFRFGRIIGTKKNVSYEYMFGATPLAIFTKNEVVNPDYVSAAVTPNITPTKRDNLRHRLSTGQLQIYVPCQKSPETVCPSRRRHSVCQ